MLTDSEIAKIAYTIIENLEDSCHNDAFGQLIYDWGTAEKSIIEVLKSIRDFKEPTKQLVLPDIISIPPIIEDPEF